MCKNEIVKVLLLGSGSKEHVLAWKLWCSEKYKDAEIIAIPGNLALGNRIECLNIPLDDINRLIEISIARQVKLVVVGESKLFSKAIVDRFQAHGIKIIGPSYAAAQIEWSQDFGKKLMIDNNIPCARFVSFNNLPMAQAYLQTCKFPLRIRTDLQFNKPFSSIPVQELNRANKILQQLFKKKLFSQEETKVIFEEIIEGFEFTINVIADGKEAVSLVPVQSYRDSEIGIDMGAYGPSSILNADLLTEIRESIINPTIHALQNMNSPYSGFLAFDIALDSNDAMKPKLIQYRTSLLDSDAQVVIPLLDEDLFEILLATANNDLSHYYSGFHRFLGSALTVNVHANDQIHDIPAEVQTIEILGNLDEELGSLNTSLDALPIVFYGKRKSTEKHSSEEEVFGATAVANNLVDAQILAYRIADKIQIPSKYYLKDIGDQGMI